MNRYYYLLWGFLIWLIVTLAVRLIGHFILLPSNLFAITVLYIMTIPMIAAVTYPIYIWQTLTELERKEAAMLFVLPGMLLDAFIVLIFAQVFPNVSMQEDGLFGAWLLWAYSLTLLTGFYPKTRAL